MANSKKPKMQEYSMDELFEEVRRKVLGYNYLNLILDDWQKVFQKEEERVVDFKV